MTMDVNDYAPEEIGPYPYHICEKIEASGETTQPLPFPSGKIAKGVREFNATVIDSKLGNAKNCSGIFVHKEYCSNENPDEDSNDLGIVAYQPLHKLQNTIFGTLWACKVLRRYCGTDAASKNNLDVDVALPTAIVWEYTPEIVAMKVTDKRKFYRQRHTVAEDPIMEVHALRFLGQKHQHLIWSMDALEDDDYLYNILPFFQGGELFNYVQDHGTRKGTGMSERHARYWFRQMLSMLRHLQSLGVCHRDISMENILLDTENNCVLIDMGMCIRVPLCNYNNEHNNGNTEDENKSRDYINKSKNSKTYSNNSNNINSTNKDNTIVLAEEKKQRRQGLIVTSKGNKTGKNLYMPPEVFTGAPFDGYKNDLWAIGVILYIMLTGFPPYKVPDPNSCLQYKLIAVDGKLFETLKKWDVHISREAGDLLQQMLQHNPTKRLTFAEVMAHTWVKDGVAEQPPPYCHTTSF